MSEFHPAARVLWMDSFGGPRLFRGKNISTSGRVAFHANGVSRSRETSHAHKRRTAKCVFPRSTLLERSGQPVSTSSSVPLAFCLVDVHVFFCFFFCFLHRCAPLFQVQLLQSWVTVAARKVAGRFRLQTSCVELHALPVSAWLLPGALASSPPHPNKSKHTRPTENSKF